METLIIRNIVFLLSLSTVISEIHFKHCESDHNSYLIYWTKNKSSDQSNADIFQHFSFDSCRTLDENETYEIFRQRNSTNVYQVLKQLDEDELYLEVKTDNDTCAGYARPQTLKEFFESEVVCLSTDSKVKLNKLTQTNETEADTTKNFCNCAWHWKGINMYILNSTHYQNPRTSLTNEISNSSTVEVNENDPLRLTFEYKLSDSEKLFDVTWSHSILEVEDVISKKNLTKKFESVKHFGNTTGTNILDLGNAQLTDNGVYDVKVECNDKIIARKSFTVNVSSKTLTNLNILVKDLNDTNRRQQVTRFLQRGLSYRIICKVNAYPHAVLTSYWSFGDNLWCSPKAGDTCQNETKIYGTYENAIYWNTSNLSSDLITCSANGTQNHTVEIVVTDIPDCQQNKGVYMEIIEPADSVDILDQDNVTVKLSLQKQYTAVKCTLGTETIVNVYAGTFATHPLRFAQDWLENPNHVSPFQLVIDDSSMYSNAVYITISNVSHSLHTGVIRCTAMDFSDTMNSYEIKLQVKKPINPWFSEKPVIPENKTQGYQPHDLVDLHCIGGGVPTPHIQWYRNEMPLNFSGNNLKFSFNASENVGDHCCIITSRAGKNEACVSVTKGKPLYDKSEFVMSLDSLCKIIFVIMTACTVVLLTVTPMSFQRRTVRKVELQDLQTMIDNETALSCQLEALDPDNNNKFVSQQILPYNSRYEVTREQIHIRGLLGEGNFGKVYESEVTLNDGQRRLCALKAPKEERNVDQIKTLLHELRFLLYVGQHENVLNVIAACTNRLADGELYVVVEFCEHGSLDEYLFKCRKTFVDELLRNDDIISQIDLDLDSYDSETKLQDTSAPRITTKNLVSYSMQAACGMEHLQQKGVIHRDLALRNLLLTYDDKIKIADFGLSRNSNYYQKLKGQQLPYKWMALESVLSRKYTSKSDVWSYGIVLWEIFSLAEEPYSGLPFDRSLIARIANGYRLQCPQYAPESMHDLMKECWNVKPDDRPDFHECQKKIRSVMNELFPEFHKISDNSDYVQLPLPVTNGVYHPVLRLSVDSDYYGSCNMSVENLAYSYSP